MTTIASPPWHVRAAQWLVGFLTHKLFDEAFDFVLYPFVIYSLGLLWGGLVMTLMSLLDCYLLLKLYDWLKRDWFGIEFVKGLRFSGGQSRWRKALAWLLNRGNAVAFIALSLRYDPFITTAYLRHGSYNGMTLRDWYIFLGSGIVSNLAWMLVCYGGLSVVGF
jgi:hypothetical protein